MKGAIQFWGQTHRHTDTQTHRHTSFCPSRAASLQLKNSKSKKGLEWSPLLVQLKKSQVDRERKDMV